MMHVLDAIKIAKEKVDKGFFLCSCFVSLRDFSLPEEWTVIFYNPEKGSLLECTCSESGITMEESRAMNEVQPLEIGDVRKDEAYVMEKVMNDFGRNPVNILISLHTKGNKATWTVALVTSDLNVTIYDIDARTGGIIKKETTGLVKRL
jgi:hypothetical protein